MIAVTLIAVALILGYVVAVGLSMLVTFGITKTAPGFAVTDHLLKTSYKFFQDLVWLVCVTAGGFVSACVAQWTTHTWLVATLLAGILIFVTWSNTWEVRQRGLGHQILINAATVAGVVAGIFLWLRVG